jgi:uncharacterized membrane protein YqiK
VAIDYLEQTPLDQHDPNNVLDSEGIKKITEITQRERVASNEFTQRAQVQVEKENADADIAKREQKRRNEEDTAKQMRAITEVKANEEAESRKVIEARRQEVESKRLEAEEVIRLRTEDMNRAVQEREFTVKKEKQRLEQESVQEGEEARVRRERRFSPQKWTRKSAAGRCRGNANAPWSSPNRRLSFSSRRKRPTSKPA